MVQDLIGPIQKRANLSDEAASTLRIYETHGCKMVKELNLNTVLASLSDYSTLYAEFIPKEEREAGDTDMAIYAFHFDKEPSKTHGVPFKFVVKAVSISRGIEWSAMHWLTYQQGELFKDTKERLSKRTGIKGKQFDKLKFAIAPRSAYSRPTYLSDGKTILLGPV